MKMERSSPILHTSTNSLTQINSLKLPKDCFDARFKTILSTDNAFDIIGISMWVNENSKGNIQVKYLRSYFYKDKWHVSDTSEQSGPYSDRVYLGFEDESDALIFKIKYMGIESFYECN